MDYTTLTNFAVEHNYDSDDTCLKFLTELVKINGKSKPFLPATIQRIGSKYKSEVLKEFVQGLLSMKNSQATSQSLQPPRKRQKKNDPRPQQLQLKTVKSRSDLVKTIQSSNVDTIYVQRMFGNFYEIPHVHIAMEKIQKHGMEKPVYVAFAISGANNTFLPMEENHIAYCVKHNIMYNTSHPRIGTTYDISKEYITRRDTAAEEGDEDGEEAEDEMNDY